MEKNMTKEKIKEIREKLGLSIERMARKCNVSERTWRRWEKGDPRPLLALQENLKKLAKEAGVEL
jgi:DNA-binding transcriptional regulator YiaG